MASLQFQSVCMLLSVFVVCQTIRRHSLDIFEALGVQGFLTPFECETSPQNVGAANV